MIVRKTVGTVGTLAQEAVTTAVSLAKHPISSTALAAGLVKGAAGAGIGLVRNTITGTSPIRSMAELVSRPRHGKVTARKALTASPKLTEGCMSKAAR